MPIVSPTNYQADLKFGGHSVGGNLVDFSIVKSEFTGDKSVGYLFFGTSQLSSTLNPQSLPYMWDDYDSDTLIDHYAKIFAAIFQTRLQTSSDIRRLSQMNSLIIDGGANTGEVLESVLALAGFFGDNRPAISTMFSANGSGFTTSTSGRERASTIPNRLQINNYFWNYPQEIECDKYRTKYQNSMFSGDRVIILTSTNATNSGSLLPHVFRNSRNQNFANLGRNIHSTLIGTIDGRLQGISSSDFYSNYSTRTSIVSLIPDIMKDSAPIKSFSTQNNQLYGFINTYSRKNMTNQLPEIKIDANDGPLKAWYEAEGGFLQAFGYTSSYERDREQYARFNSVLGLPIATLGDTYHYPYLEDSILAATAN
jgi:hypothetical protein